MNLTTVAINKNQKMKGGLIMKAVGLYGRNKAMAMLWAGLFLLLARTNEGLGQDAGVEFGVEDDLTVLGTDGSLNDPDVEIRGYTVFGNPQGQNISAPFTNGAGTVVISSNLWVGGVLKPAGGIEMEESSMVVSNLEVRGYLHAKGSSLEVATNALMKASLAIQQNLVVGQDAVVTGQLTSGSAAVSGTLSVAGPTVHGTNVVIQSSQQSTAPGDGALVVEGGVGVGKNLNIGGQLQVADQTLLNGTLAVQGITILGTNLVVESTQSSLGINNGALVVKGGTGIGKSLNVGETLTVAGSGTFGGSVSVEDDLVVNDLARIKGDLVVEGTGLVSNTLVAVSNVGLATAGTGVSVGIGTTTPDANTKVDIRGGGASGDYAIKIYVGTDVAAWVRKK